MDKWLREMKPFSPQEGGGRCGDEAQTRRTERWERALRWAGLDHASLKYQSEDPGAMGRHGGRVSRGGAQSQFMSYKDPSGVGMGCPESQCQVSGKGT